MTQGYAASSMSNVPSTQGGWASGKRNVHSQIVNMASSAWVRGSFEGSFTASLTYLHKDKSRVDIDSAEAEFQRQEEAFIYKTENEPLFFSPYLDEFVIFYNGDILDHDLDLEVLTDRFFSRNPDVPAIIKKLGHPTTVTIDTPFFD